MENYRVESESKQREIESLKEELADLKSDLEKERRGKNNFFEKIANVFANTTPFLIMAFVGSSLTSLVVSSHQNLQTEEQKDYARKRDFVHECLSGKGVTERIEGVLVCHGGTADGKSL